MTLLSTSSIIGIIVSIALVAMTIAVCLYLYSLKSKEDVPGEDSSHEDSTN
ncbi:MAG: hypothetical protein IJS52_09280 [Bacilli bacterium]|nr:hypothetical protein [Bacilli bacterium]